MLIANMSLKSAATNEDFQSMSEADALFLIAGDPTSEDEPMRKGSCFQVCFVLRFAASFIPYLKHAAMASGL